MSEAEWKGEIRFFQACLPPLTPGDYTIEVSQRVDEEFEQSLDFSAAGPRFTLNPADIYSVFPPSGQTGAFDNTLPQVVFTRRTLPWERTIDGNVHNAAQPCPWMALLVLGPSDGAGQKFPKIDTRKLLDRDAEGEGLLNPPAGVQGPAGLERERYERENELCNTIDLDADLFRSIVPSRADLPYLAHVRTVDTDDKETLSYLSEGCFSVVLANRFPESALGEKGARNTACLVSLEGFQNFLYPKESPMPTVRLAVLASWSFICRGKNDFKAIVTDLDGGKPAADAPDFEWNEERTKYRWRPAENAESKGARKRPSGPWRAANSGLMSLPPPDWSEDTGAALEDATAEDLAVVREAFERGYCGLNHLVRVGEKTVSWYRGPLVPLYIHKQQQYGFISCADAALRYDYETGMLDASYAAAWQLGRLLALQSRHFSQAMYRYRKEVALRIMAKIRAREASKRFGASAETARNFLETKAIGTLTKGRERLAGKADRKGETT